jgi:hypothetical protein
MALSNRMPIFDPPDLDNLNAAELADMAEIFTTLAHFCHVKRNAALAFRLGKSDECDNLERKAISVYMTLPEWARW